MIIVILNPAQVQNLLHGRHGIVCPQSSQSVAFFRLKLLARVKSISRAVAKGRMHLFELQVGRGGGTSSQGGLSRA